MSQAVGHHKKPFLVSVTKGQDYWWCACGLSQSQSFCDQSHQGSEHAPILFQEHESGTVSFCGCKLTECAPLCDCSHMLFGVNN